MSTYFPSLEEIAETRDLLCKTQNSQISNSHPSIPLLSSSSQSELRIFYELKIIELCTYLKFSYSITITAALIHKRYYLKSSIISSRDPKHIMLCCVFLASKMNNLRLQVSEYCSLVPGTAAALILEYEFHILTDIAFDIEVPPLDAALDGVLLLAQGFGIDAGQMRKFVDERYMKSLVCSDALLAFSHSYLALSMVFEMMKEEFPEKSNLFVEHVGALAAGFSMEICHAVLLHLNSFKPPEQNSVKGVDLMRKEIVAKIFSDNSV